MYLRKRRRITQARYLLEIMLDSEATVVLQLHRSPCPLQKSHFPPGALDFEIAFPIDMADSPPQNPSPLASPAVPMALHLLYVMPATDIAHRAPRWRFPSAVCVL